MTGMKSVRDSPHWRVSVTAVRGVLAAAVLLALYYAVPLDLRFGVSGVARLVIGFLVFIGIMVWQVGAITESKNPGLRALQATLLVLPLFLVLFASTYYMMSRGDSASFTEDLSRTDALYLTVTIFSTVGFGDISPKLASARVVVSVQMILDLVLLGLGVRILLNAVQRGRDGSRVRLTTARSVEARASFILFG